MNLAENFEEILNAFNRFEVDYMIVGGYAVIFHGYGRSTGDLDIWVNPTYTNKEKIIHAFASLAYDSESLLQIENLDFSKPFSFKVGEGLFVVDVLNSISGLIYEEEKKQVIPFDYSEKLSVNFIHLHDLVTNKMSTGRLKDLADVEELQKIHIFSKNTSIIHKIKALFKKKE
ncbi:MAG: hypothetical protein HYU67_03900 [Flavobacteriia bacterium]|nr:hypothetical protein [Flavobacteriia bacterium]